MSRLIFNILIILLPLAAVGQASNIWLEPNKGQWDDQILHRIKIPKGFFYVNHEGFYYSVSNVYDLLGHNHNEEEGHTHDIEDETYVQHHIKATFLNSNFNDFQEKDPSSTLYNYFLGKDPKKWAKNVNYYQSATYQNIYPGIDLELRGLSSSLKYDLKLQPNADPNQIRIKYQGQNRLFVKDGSLKIQTEFGLIEELKPIAFYADSGEKIEVEFQLRRNIVSFKFPNGYDQTKAIVIDPEIVFSTFTGALSDNWGNSACPGPNGEAYGTGISFGPDYPITAGVFQTTFAGGVPTGTSIPGFDVSITKFSSDGSQNLYSTFIGGNANELAHSTITDDVGNLYIYGSTASNNFPMHINAAFPNRNTNSIGNIYASGLAFDQTDAFIIKLSPDGTTLLGSTFYGGSDWDGLNSAAALRVNYGDYFKGEINLDPSGNVFIAGNTRSSDLPVLGAISNVLQGSDDGFIAKFNSDLSSHMFSSYISGSGVETCYGIDFDSNGDIFVGGGTTSSDFLSNYSGNYTNTPNGGPDGYVLKINGTTYALEAIRFVGTTAYDQTYFVRADPDDNIYVFGQTMGDFPIVNANYADTNGSQFIQKFTNNLSTVEVSSVFGSGRTTSSGLRQLDIAPTAFSISDCYEILVAGYGGNQNTASQYVDGTVGTSTTVGLNLTPDAFMNVTSGNDFYIAKFSEDMDSLKYATFMGAGGLDTAGNVITDTAGNQVLINSTIANHVDGGTSRFDANGEIYHAVCASCSANIGDGFTITPGAFAPQVGSNNCNMAVFKFALLDVSADFLIPFGTLCFFDSIQFVNNSQGGSYVEWHFGDGNTSSLENPTHLYGGPGIYHVTLIVYDTTECLVIDSTSLDIELFGYQGAVDPVTDTLCPGETVQLNAYNGILYQWEPANLVDDPTSNSPIATVDSTTIFTVVVGDDCYQDTLDVIVNVENIIPSITPDTIICEGESVQIQVSGGISYSWSPTTGLNDPNISNPIASPVVATMYYVDITTPAGCGASDSIFIDVVPSPDQDPLPDEIQICLGSSHQFSLPSGFDYSWGNNYFISDTDSNIVIVNPPIDTTYYVSVSNVCGTYTDTVDINVVQVYAETGNDTIICKGASLNVTAIGGSTYQWFPSAYFDDPNAQNPIVTPPYPMEIWVQVTDSIGCTDTDSMFINFYPTTFLTVSPDYYGLEGDTAQIWASATGPGTLFWTPAEYIECTNCDTTIVYPPNNMTYIANFIDTNGCLITNSVNIYFDPLLYVPNTFTPNGDGMNDFFGAKGGNFRTFELLIFNRWGELIFEGEHIDDWWDGKYKGEYVQDGVYVWKIRYEDLNGNIKVVYGHVTSLR